MNIERSICGKFVRVLWMGNVLSVMTIEEWSKLIARPGEFVKGGA